MPWRRTSMLMTSSSCGWVICRSLHHSPFTPARAIATAKSQLVMRRANPASSSCTRTGKTKGRGKLDRSNSHALPVKDVYLYPLHRDYRHILATASNLSVTGQHRVNTEHM